jgi:uncharacterized membrane protein YedE/YeeE
MSLMENMVAFEDVWKSLAGGGLIGLSATVLLLGTGRVAGITGILGGLLRVPSGDTAWRAAFLAGLASAGAVMAWWVPAAFEVTVDRPVALLMVGGSLAGFGARLGSGCTSGHGVCGISRLSGRSMVATCVFVATGMVTVYLTNLGAFVGLAGHAAQGVHP